MLEILKTRFQKNRNLHPELKWSEVEERLRDRDWDITVAVMGCVVNGPGEASHADYGIAGGKSEGMLFKHGVRIARVPVERLADALTELIESENG